MALLRAISNCFVRSTVWSNYFTAFFDLGIRLYIAQIFFKSGYVKIQSMATTVMLFENEYEVPLLPSEWAAYLGTGAELALPVLIALGLGARLPAVALFVFNVVAAFSYPYLWTDRGWCAMKDHIFWGFLIAMMWFHGPGKLSLDYLLVRKAT